MNKDENRIEELENKIAELENKLVQLNEKQDASSADEAEEAESEEAESEEADADENASEGIEGEEIADEESEKKSSKLKGNQASLFSSDTTTVFSAMANSEEMEHKYTRAVTLRMALVMGILTLSAIILRFAKFTPTYLPEFLNLEFSALPEVLASIAYGPIFGIIIVIIKNIVYIILTIRTLSIPAIITNVVLNSVFVYITGAYYSRKMFPFDPEYQPTRDMRRLFIFSGGAIASGVVGIASFFFAKYIKYPITFKYYNYKSEEIVFIYQQALDRINAVLPDKLSGIIKTVDSLNRGILYFDVPHTFFKYLLVTILAVILYNLISPFLHYRNMVNEEEAEELELQQTDF